MEQLFCFFFFLFYVEKWAEDAEDAEVSELCGSAPLHPVRCPVINLYKIKQWDHKENNHDDKSKDGKNKIVNGLIGMKLHVLHTCKSIPSSKVVHDYQLEITKG